MTRVCGRGGRGEGPDWGATTKAINRPPYCRLQSTTSSLALRRRGSSAALPSPHPPSFFNVSTSSSTSRARGARQVANLEIAFLIYNRASVRPSSFVLFCDLTLASLILRFPSSILRAPLPPPLVPFLPRLSTPWILYRPRLSNNPLLPPRCRESTDFS